jgi:hypothetical protein
MTRGKAEAIGVLVDAIIHYTVDVAPRDQWFVGLDALAVLLRPSPNAMAHGACELAERQILEHRMQMTQLDALCASLHAIMGNDDA